MKTSRKISLSDWLGLGAFCYLNGEAWYFATNIMPGHVWFYWVMIGSLDTLAFAGLFFTHLWRNMVDDTQKQLKEVLSMTDKLLKALYEASPPNEDSVDGSN